MDSEFKVPILNNINKIDNSRDSGKVSAENAEKDKLPKSLTTPESKPGNTIENVYKEPNWAEIPPENVTYSFEVLKNGVIVENVENLQQKSYWIFGRLPDCHVFMAHPTVSRFHAILQYGKLKSTSQASDEDPENDGDIEKSGWYLYDLGSTHGTFMNKLRMPPKKYIRLKVGYMIQFGSSTRKFILQGPNTDEEDESPYTITELRAMQQQKALDREREAQEAEKKKQEEGISWGISDDADEETDHTLANPFASSCNEELFLDDPKKTLRGFFEREGLELEYKVEDSSAGTYICRVELPLEDDCGRPIIAEYTHKGKKKDAVHQGALEACRILDRHGVLRQSYHEPRKRKQKDSDSDDDCFFDRTGDVERKRELKKISTGSALSYDELLEQEKEVIKEIDDINNKIKAYEQSQAINKKNMESNDDDLDSYMRTLQSTSKADKIEIRKYRFELQRLTQKHDKLKSLIKIAKPLFPTTTNSTADDVVSPPLESPMKFERSENKAQLKLVAETVISKETTQPIVETVTVQKTASTSSGEVTSAAEPKSVDEIKIPPVPQKSRSKRIRIRHTKRDDVDIDDSNEVNDSEKFSNWLPPQNQAGDGFTSLNEKFGY